MIYIWSIVLAVTFFSEILTPSALVSIWFFFGSIVALVAAIFSFPIWSQCSLFIFVSIACIIVVRPLARQAMRGNVEATSIERYIGQRFLLRKNIEEEKDGTIQINGIPWRVRSYDGKTIQAGNHVEILSFDGTKAIVKIVKEKENA